MWLRSTNGHEMERPCAENGIYIKGPLSSDDIKAIISALCEDLVDVAKDEVTANMDPDSR